MSGDGELDACSELDVIAEGALAEVRDLLAVHVVAPSCSCGAGGDTCDEMFMYCSTVLDGALPDCVEWTVGFMSRWPDAWEWSTEDIGGEPVWRAVYDAVRVDLGQRFWPQLRVDVALLAVPAPVHPDVARLTLDQYLHGEPPPDGWHLLDNMDADDVRDLAKLAIGRLRAGAGVHLRSETRTT